MKIEELLSGNHEKDQIKFDGVSVPVSALRKLLEEGYAHLQVYKENGTFSLWGKTKSACFTADQLRDRAK